MEVAFFLGDVGARARRVASRSSDARPRRAASRGARGGSARRGALLVVDPPRSRDDHRRLRRRRRARASPRFGCAARASLLLAHRRSRGASCSSLQAIANRALTGEWSANGAIVKLALNNPYLTADEKLDDYIFNSRTYARSFRNIEYHFTDSSRRVGDSHRPGARARVAARRAPIARARTRASLLVGADRRRGCSLVALNGQVRWQNERYTMPAVAWLLVLAALGASARSVARARGRAARPSSSRSRRSARSSSQVVGVLTRARRHDPDVPSAVAPRARRRRRSRALMLRAVAAARRARRARAALRVRSPRSRRCATRNGSSAARRRNIRDQHLIARASSSRELKPQRVLVGDAGALLYASDRPGLDIIGLGGYHELPFARAGVHGLAATLELIERIPTRDRPDVLAIFPTWWGVLPDVVRERRARALPGRRQRDLRRLRERHLPRRLARARHRRSPRASCRRRRAIARRGRRRRSREREASTATRSTRRRAAGPT